MRLLISVILCALLASSIYAQGKTTHFALITCPAQTVNACSKDIKDGPMKALYPMYSRIKGYVKKQNQADNSERQVRDFCSDNYIPITTIKVFTDNIQISQDKEKEATIIIDSYTSEEEKDQITAKSTYTTLQKNVAYKTVEIDMIGLESVSEKNIVNLFTVQGQITSENRTKWDSIYYYELKNCTVVDPRKYN